jgi:hypothetical protein
VQWQVSPALIQQRFSFWAKFRQLATKKKCIKEFKNRTSRTFAIFLRKQKKKKQEFARFRQ